MPIHELDVQQIHWYSEVKVKYTIEIVHIVMLKRQEEGRPFGNNEQHCQKIEKTALSAITRAR